MGRFIEWFTGGEHYTYHNLFHCIDNDLVTITIVVMLCIGIFSGYMVIAYRWFEAAKSAPESDARKALNDLKWIFIMCGACSYLWVVLETVWPAWRLYMIGMAILNFFTWRYVIRIDSLERIYLYLRDKDDLIKEIEDKQRIIEKLQRAHQNP